MSDLTIPVRFRWTTTSPEAHNVTMRNQLEPLDVVVVLEVPAEKEYFVNFNLLKEHALKISKHKELEIKASLSADIESAGEGPGQGPDPILTFAGLKYAVNALSMGNSEFEPETEDLEEWDDNVESASDDDFGDDFEETDTVSDDNEDFDWDEEWE